MTLVQNATKIILITLDIELKGCLKSFFIGSSRLATTQRKLFTKCFHGFDIVLNISIC